ncbi:hypothetical protein AcidC75_00710 [Acidisoma sp. C75]
MFEILSPGTAATDLIDKNAEYRTIPSLQRYVILGQYKATPMSFIRRGGGEICSSEIASGAEAVLALPDIHLSIPLAELYLGVASSDEPKRGEG